MVGWQNAPGHPSTTVADLYDGAGHRVAWQVTQSGTTTTPSTGAI
jgi:YD repeat-containing protein